MSPSTSKDQRAARVEIIRDEGTLDALARSWLALEDRAVLPTQHFGWVRACAGAFGERGELHVIAIRTGDTCAAVAPLVRTPGWGSRLESIGVESLYEPSDFLAADEATLDALAIELTRQRAVLVLPRVPADSPFIPALERAFSRRGWLRVTPGEPYPRIELGPTWTEEAQLNAGRRSDLRRAEHHARKLGAVTYEVRSPTPGEVGPLLDEAYAIEAKSWKLRKGTALAVDRMCGKFFRDYVAAAATSGIIRIAFMRIGGTAVAMQIGAECHDRFWLFKIGYDEAHAKASPGALLMLHTLRQAAARGLASYEFLGGARPWTASWTKELRACVEIRAYPLSVLAAAGLGHDAVRWAIAYAKERLDRAAPHVRSALGRFG